MRTEHSILRALAYFDVFRYPLTAEEIHLYIDSTVAPASLGVSLQNLLAEQKIFELKNYYSLHDEPLLAERRQQGNERAVDMLQTAYRIGRSLYKFPFVRGVGISGSLSKNYAEPDADIDFFIITSRNHLWIARTFLHGLKKLSFLIGKQHWYCMNYFIDEDALVIAEKNIFTATEVVTLKPVYGAFQSFYKENQWAMDHFPNHPVLQFPDYGKREPFLKRAIEKIFRSQLGDRLDNWLMKITAERWMEKERKHKLNSKGNPLGLIAGKHFARPNPEHFQKKIMCSVNERIGKIQAPKIKEEIPFIFSVAK